MHLLVEQYKTRAGGLRGEMSDVSTSKSGAPKACETFTTLGNPRVEVRPGLLGVCSRLTTHPEEEQRNSAHRGLTHEDGSPYSHEKHMDLRPIGLAYLEEIVRLHGVPTFIVSDLGTRLQL